MRTYSFNLILLLNTYKIDKICYKINILIFFRALSVVRIIKTTLFNNATMKLLKPVKFYFIPEIFSKVKRRMFQYCNSPIFKYLIAIEYFKGYVSLASKAGN